MEAASAVLGGLGESEACVVGLPIPIAVVAIGRVEHTQLGGKQLLRKIVEGPLGHGRWENREASQDAWRPSLHEAQSLGGQQRGASTVHDRAGGAGEPVAETRRRPGAACATTLPPRRHPRTGARRRRRRICQTGLGGRWRRWLGQGGAEEEERIPASVQQLPGGGGRMLGLLLHCGLAQQLVKLPLPARGGATSLFLHQARQHICQRPCSSHGPLLGNHIAGTAKVGEVGPCTSNPLPAPFGGTTDRQHLGAVAKAPNDVFMNAAHEAQ
mmetsp:Transcript_153670/g.492602  ORF Transcript_153670/g.492602 Transcript_153670/m.492602 type:complete len:270 (+) Transcript_153670:1313-2122(+)